MTAVHRVAVLVFDGVKLLDVAGPSEVFAEANRGGANYELVICSVGGHDVDSSTGMRIPVDRDVVDSGSFDTLLVMGGDVFPSTPVSPELREAASDLAGRSGRVASICTGTFILAASGLLDGRRATTHWQHTATLARAYPQITVVPDAIFIQDGAVFSSAGVTAGISTSRSHCSSVIMVQKWLDASHNFWWDFSSVQADSHSFRPRSVGRGLGSLRSEKWSTPSRPIRRGSIRSSNWLPWRT